MRSKFLNMVALLLAISVTACAKSNSETGVISDPFENVNRTTLKVNDTLDQAVVEPIAQGYRKFTPRAGRVVVSNFLRNLNSPVVIGNQLLQGDIEGATNATARTVINTLAGFGGILDLATEGGIPHEPEDFGQTLAVWGVGSGPYLMMPFLGPSNVRDFSGRIIDGYIDPLRLYLFNVDEDHLQYTRTGLTLLSQREELLDVVDDLRRHSFDYYAAIRSAYTQQRRALISDQGKASVDLDFPEYDG